MNGKIRLDTRKNQERKEGFPVVVFLNHKGKQKNVSLGVYFHLKDWDLKNQMPIKNPKMALFVRKKQLLLDEIVFDYKTTRKANLESAKKILLGGSGFTNIVSFYEFYESYLSELTAAQKKSTHNIYKTALDQLKKYRTNLDFTDVDYSTLNGFKDWRISLGNSKSTVHTYLRKIRTVYNEAVRRGVAKDTKPFDGVFKGITVKSNRTKKRNITKESIVKLENAMLRLDGKGNKLVAPKKLPMYHQRAIDLWLLLFYFGGQDLKDVYYLEYKNINNGRVYFTRSKLAGSGYQFDLKIVPKAQKIIDKYKVKGKYLFPWPKDFDSYKSFRDNLRRSLDFVQKQEKIEVLPLGGQIRIKVARHTFATLGKNLFLDSDLLRELMGHERNDVDTIYKDKYPEILRDEAHLKIIE
ncbi:site-specific integrase [Polaribacter haliotis]|uniref:Site-specific integrase n=1 Tax=Polaribacter haliotis TaxID=1888915 RepID=A0A7L8AF23_9FLAO|nr:site-specific integrase [Polaribacter haliotis]QOD60616.1 site-specific integrase [Polaribacter haliotis]